jgi:hypothetical protein
MLSRAQRFPMNTLNPPDSWLLPPDCCMVMRYTNTRTGRVVERSFSSPESFQRTVQSLINIGGFEATCYDHTHLFTFET